jgi:hypothetical protein
LSLTRHSVNRRALHPTRRARLLALPRFALLERPTSATPSPSGGEMKKPTPKFLAEIFLARHAFPRRGMARRKTQAYGIRDPCGPRRAPLGAPYRGGSRRRAPLHPRSSRGLAASSWQDLLVGPGGAPAPPECSYCVHEPAGTAPRPAQRTPREAPFSRTRWMHDNVSAEGGDKFRWRVYLQRAAMLLG